MVSQLVRLSDVLVTFGLTAENILLPFLYIIVPFLAIILPISFLFGTMISFSRLSTDGEFIALLASGYSMRAMLMPPLILSLGLYIIGAICAVNLEAWGRREFVQFIYRKTQTELDNMVRTKIQPGVFVHDFLGYVLYTENVSEDRVSYSNVMLAPQKTAQGNFVMLAPSAQIQGTVETGNLRMILYKGISYSQNHGSKTTSTLEFDRAEIDLLRVFQEKILGQDSAIDDYRSFTMTKLWDYLQKTKSDPAQLKEYWKASYLFHSRFANPFIIIAFTLLGLIFGIHEQRQAKNLNYIATIATVIASFVILMGFRRLAEEGKINSFAAAWIPQLMVLLFAVFCMYQKNRLPLSEQIFARQNLPRFWRTKS